MFMTRGLAGKSHEQATNYELLILNGYSNTCLFTSTIIVRGHSVQSQSGLTQF